MGKKGLVIGIISIILVSYGVIYSILNKMFCRGICDSCSSGYSVSCSYLLIFVGIIFIVSGTSLYQTYKDIEVIREDFLGSKRLKKFIDSENKSW